MRKTAKALEKYQKSALLSRLFVHPKSHSFKTNQQVLQWSVNRAF